MAESIRCVRTKAVACLTLILPQVIGLHWDNTAASDFLNTAASDWKILPQVMGHPVIAGTAVTAVLSSVRSHILGTHPRWEKE